MLRLYICVFFATAFSLAHGQSHLAGTAPRDEPEPRFSAGAEGVIFANRNTQLLPSSSFLSAGDKDLSPRPALWVGYGMTPCVGVEVGLQLLPVATSYAYQDAELGYRQSYSNDYTYVPLRGVWQALGHNSQRWRLHVFAGGGPAFTDLSSGLPIGPASTSGYTLTEADGSTKTLTVAQRVTAEKASFFVFEGGLRGSWRLWSVLSLDLTVRQLWSPMRSARDMQVVVQTDVHPTRQVSAGLTTPVSGICTGIGIRYLF